MIKCIFCHLATRGLVLLKSSGMGGEGVICVLLIECGWSKMDAKKYTSARAAA